MFSGKIKYSLVAVVVLMTVLVIMGCKFIKTKEGSMSISNLLGSPEKITVDDRTYVLETYLWRDFMPVSPPDGQPLMAAIRIVATDSAAFPALLDADKMWVVKERKEVWETKFIGEQREGEPNKLEKFAQDGPKWGPGIEVDVVVRLVKDSKTFLLKATKVSITKTE